MACTCCYITIVTSALIVLVMCHVTAADPPSPGFYPSATAPAFSFSQGYRNLWGASHQSIDQHGTVTLWLDRSSGSGFKSLARYSSGYFGASMKLHPGYTAGVITSFYLSNNEDFPGNHDEIDIEFLGTTPGKPYTLQTNVYVRGSGDGSRIIGREMKFHLWFDPTKDFHHYAILWTQTEILFFVDDVPIRRYRNKGDETFPTRPMWAYGSIWDASSWATENGKYKADYRYQPFVGRYNNFRTKGDCSTNCGRSTTSGSSSSPGGWTGLSSQQVASMQWVHKNYLVYNYCNDPKRDHSKTPEC